MTQFEGQFEALTAFRPVASESVIMDMRQAADGVLGEGAVDFHSVRRSGVELLSVEELAAMHKLTGALGDLSMPQLIKTTAALAPDTFKIGSTFGVHLVETTRAEKPELVVTSFSHLRRLREERRAFTDAAERIAGADIPWRKQLPRFRLGTVVEGVKIGKKELKEIKERIPVRKVKVKRGNAEPVRIARPVALAIPNYQHK